MKQNTKWLIFRKNQRLPDFLLPKFDLSSGLPEYIKPEKFEFIKDHYLVSYKDPYDNNKLKSSQVPLDKVENENHSASITLKTGTHYWYRHKFEQVWRICYIGEDHDHNQYLHPIGSPAMQINDMQLESFDWREIQTPCNACP